MDDMMCATAGRRRQVVAPVQALRGAQIDVGSATYTACDGDSGGPALLAPQVGAPESIVGIVSYAPPGCSGRATLTATAASLALIDGWLSADKALGKSGGCSVAVAPSDRPPHSGHHAPLSMLLLATGLFLRRRGHPSGHLTASARFSHKVPGHRGNGLEMMLPNRSERG